MTTPLEPFQRTLAALRVTALASIKYAMRLSQEEAQAAGYKNPDHALRDICERQFKRIETAIKEFEKENPNDL